MEWLNYHHLLYFRTVATEGGIARACEKLNLAQPAISGQLKQLEETPGRKSVRQESPWFGHDRGCQVVYRYAEEIFGRGRELQNAPKGQPQGRPLRMLVGISDLMPKMLASRILQPALAMEQLAQIVCDEDTQERMLAQLADHRLDFVLSAAPIPPLLRVKSFNHLLGSCTLTVLAAHNLTNKYRKTFPSSLNGAPFLLPMEGASLRRSLEQWFDQVGVRPILVGEFKNRAMMDTFGQAGAGLFAVPSVIEKEARQHYIGGIDQFPGGAHLCRLYRAEIYAM